LQSDKLLKSSSKVDQTEMQATPTLHSCKQRQISVLASTSQ